MSGWRRNHPYAAAVPQVERKVHASQVERLGRFLPVTRYLSRFLRDLNFVHAGFAAAEVGFV